MEVDLDRGDHHSVGERHARVRERIDAAARRAGREPSAITLVAITKGFGARAVVAAARAGVAIVGENRVQEARAKKPEAEERLAGEPGLVQPSWHLVGHLQRNKVRAALELFDWIESVDSLALAEELSRRQAATGRELPILVEVKTAPEESKHGVLPDEALDVVPAIAVLPGLDLRGLMTIGPLDAPARPAFRALSTLRDRLAEGMHRPLPHLSMGMSGDFEAAVEEGATLVRLGTALFGPRPG